MKLKTIYEPKGAAREYAALGLNVYTGCDHGCTYCYAPAATKTKKENFSIVKNRPEKFLEWVKHDAAELRAEGTTDHIHLSFTTDPYCHFDVGAEMTRKVLRILLSHDLNVQILTKGGNRSMRDSSLIFDHPDQVRYGATLTSMNDIRDIEPYAASFDERMRVLEVFHDQGVFTWVSLEPVLFPSEALDAIRATQRYVDLYWIGKLNHDKEREAKIDWNKFGRDAISVCVETGSAFRIKEALKIRMM